MARETWKRHSDSIIQMNGFKHYILMPKCLLYNSKPNSHHRRLYYSLSEDVHKWISEDSNIRAYSILYVYNNGWISFDRGASSVPNPKGAGATPLLNAIGLAFPTVSELMTFKLQYAEELSQNAIIADI